MLVAAVVVRVAAVLLVAALAHDLDVGAARAPVLRAEGVEEDLDLGDGVEVDVLGHAVGLAHLVAQHAVDGDVVPAAAHAAHQGDERAEALAQRLHRILVAHAGHRPHHGRDVAPLALDLLDLLRRDEARVLRLLGVHAVGRRLDGDALPEADGELDDADRQPARGAQDVPLLLDGAEVRHLRAHGVRVRRHGREEEVAMGVGGVRARGARALVDRGHRGAGDPRSLLVDDRPGDRAGDGLGAGGRRKRDGHGQDA